MSDAIKTIHIDDDGSIFVRRLTSYNSDTGAATFTEWKQISQEQFSAINRKVNEVARKFSSDQGDRDEDR